MLLFFGGGRGFFGLWFSVMFCDEREEKEKRSINVSLSLYLSACLSGGQRGQNSILFSHCQLPPTSFHSILFPPLYPSLGHPRQRQHKLT